VSWITPESRPERRSSEGCAPRAGLQLKASLLMVSTPAPRFAQSARREPRSEGWFHESEQRYFETHFGARGRKGLARTAAAHVPSGLALPAVPRLEWKGGRGLLVAVSPVVSFRPFVLFRPVPSAGSFELPPEVAAGHAGTTWFARAFDEARGFHGGLAA